MPKRKRNPPSSSALTQTCPQTPSTCPPVKGRDVPTARVQVGNGAAAPVFVREQVVLGQAHDKFQAVVFELFQPVVTHKPAVVQHHANASAFQQGHALLEVPFGAVNTQAQLECSR